MSESLPLAELHREAGATFIRAGDLELPAAFGAESSDEHGYVRSGVGLLDQSYRGVVDLEGEAAKELLERISSNHPGRLDARNGQPACILTAKGRLVAAFHLFLLDAGRYRLVLREAGRPSFLRELEKYAFLSDVNIVDRAGSLSILSLQGPRAPECLARATGLEALPGEVLERAPATVAGRSVVVVRVVDLAEVGFDLWVHREDLPGVWKELLETTGRLAGGPVGWTAEESLRLEQGIALHGVDYGDENFPNEVGWEHALTYDKCYVGQEIVARMRTYGQVNRKLFRIFPEGERIPPPGSPILLGDSRAGEITSSAYSYLHRAPLALGGIRRRFWEETALVIDVEGERLAFRREEFPDRA